MNRHLKRIDRQLDTIDDALKELLPLATVQIDPDGMKAKDKLAAIKLSSQLKGCLDKQKPEQPGNRYSIDIGSMESIERGRRSSASRLLGVVAACPLLALSGHRQLHRTCPLSALGWVICGLHFRCNLLFWNGHKTPEFVCKRLRQKRKDETLNQRVQQLLPLHDQSFEKEIQTAVYS